MAIINNNKDSHDSLSQIREKVTSEIYTTVEQKLECPDLFLNMLKRSIEAQNKKPASSNDRVFNPAVNIQLDFQTQSLNENEINKILEIINNNKNSPESLNQIKAFLLSKTTVPGNVNRLEK